MGMKGQKMCIKERKETIIEESPEGNGWRQDQEGISLEQE